MVSCIINILYDLMVRVFANGPVDRHSILGWVIPKIRNMVLDGSFRSTQHYEVEIKGKWGNPEK